MIAAGSYVVFQHQSGRYPSEDEDVLARGGKRALRGRQGRSLRRERAIGEPCPGPQ